MVVFGTFWGPKFRDPKVSPGTTTLPDYQHLNTAKPPDVVSVGNGCHRARSEDMRYTDLKSR